MTVSVVFESANQLCIFAVSEWVLVSTLFQPTEKKKLKMEIAFGVCKLNSSRFPERKKKTNGEPPVCPISVADIPLTYEILGSHTEIPIKTMR